jgi:FkbM family methyltransferase
MKKLILHLYQMLPPSIVNSIGTAQWLKPLRDKILRSENGAQAITVTVNRDYAPYFVSFKFHAAIRVAAKAKEKGIENTLLRNTISLLRAKGIAEKAVILDVGTNYGYLSMVWSQTLASNGGKVYSFEPSRGVFRAFQQTIQLNGTRAKNILTENKAVGLHTGNIELYDSGTTSNIIEQENVKENYLVPMVSIDDYAQSADIQKIDLIKIDVDGIEHEILRGAKNVLMEQKPVLVIETNNDPRIITFCSDLGYQVLDMNLAVYDRKDAIPSNVFCV